MCVESNAKSNTCIEMTLTEDSIWERCAIQLELLFCFANWAWNMTYTSYSAFLERTISEEKDDRCHWGRENNNLGSRRTLLQFQSWNLCNLSFEPLEYFFFCRVLFRLCFHKYLVITMRNRISQCWGWGSWSHRGSNLLPLAQRSRQMVFHLCCSLC